MNFIISVICSLLLGYLCATFLFESQKSTTPTFQDMNHVFFLQYEEPLTEENSSLAHLLIKGETKKVYAGITTLEENAKKIQSEYQKQGIHLLIQEGSVDSEEFISELSQYDILLKSTKTTEELNSVLSI